MTTFTDDELAALRAVAEAATPGPWMFCSNHAGWIVSTAYPGAKQFSIAEIRTRWPSGAGLHRDNARYLAAFAPPTALRLLAELAAARATIARASALLPKWGANITTLATEMQEGGGDNRQYYLGLSNAYTNVWNDLSCALAVPETPEQAEARLADHREDERLDQMADADAQEEQE